MSSRTKLGLITLFVIGLLVFIPRLFGVGVYQFDDLKSPNFSLLGDKTEPDTSLKQSVEASLQKHEVLTNTTKGKFAVYVETLDGEKKYGFNDQESMYSASLYKLVLMAAILKYVESGSINLDDGMSASKQRLLNILGESGEGYQGTADTLSFSVDEGIKRMATFSDNFAAIMLAEKLMKVTGSKDEREPLAQMAQEIGMAKSDFKSEYISTTASDMGLFFKKLYLGEIISKSASDKIIDELSKAQINNRIPALLPKELKIAHKTGELPRVRHDAGIVYLEGKPYIVVLMSEDLKKENEGMEIEANISKDIYDYFTSLDE